MSAHKPARSSALVLFLLAGFLPMPLQAQDDPVLAVRFEYRHPSFKNQFPSDADRVASEAALTDRLNIVFGDKIGIWQFVSGDATAFPRLDVFMAKDGDKWKVRLALIADSTNQAAAQWDAPFLEEGDDSAFGTLPPRSGWPGRIVEKLRDRILDGTLDQGPCSAVFAALGKWVSLGKEVIPLGPLPPTTEDDARAALLLDWEKHCRISKSTFLIEFDWGANGEVKLRSYGVSRPATYDAAKPPGILVKHRRWTHAGNEEPVANHLSQLGMLRPVAVWLAQFVRHTSPCSAAAGTDLTTAPER